MKKLALAAFVVILCVGCNDAYGVVAKGSSDVATAIGSAENSLDAVRTQGLMSSTEEQSVLGYLNFANTQNGNLQTCAKGVHTATPGAAPSAYIACVNTFSDSIADPAQLAEIHVSNPQGQQKVELIIQSIQAAAAGINTALLAVKGAK